MFGMSKKAILANAVISVAAVMICKRVPFLQKLTGL